MRLLLLETGAHLSIMNPAALRILRQFPRLLRRFLDGIPPSRWKTMSAGAKAKAIRSLKASDELMQLAKKESGRDRRRILRQARRARKWGGTLEWWAGVLQARADRG